MKRINKAKLWCELLDWRAYAAGSRRGNRAVLPLVYSFKDHTAEILGHRCPRCLTKRRTGTPFCAESVYHIAHYIGIKPATLRREILRQAGIAAMRDAILVKKRE